VTQRTERTLLVVCDFDDTAADCNAAQRLIAEFAGPDAAAINQEYREGALTFRDYQEKIISTITAPVEELRSWARDNVNLRSGFLEAVETTREQGGQFMIASAGIDFYIEPVLAANGLDDVPILSVMGEPTAPDGTTMSFRYDYPSNREFCRDWAVCKCEPIEKARAAGQKVIFIGDGLRSDSCAAEKADTVFARSRLLEHCRNNDVEAIEFEDFHSIAEYISEFNLRPDQNSTNSTPTKAAE
jgi:2-hydroxy-3-keto-5-methylthiopentenyl-1-phosphate phosphatase